MQFKWKCNIFIWTIAFLYDILQNFPFFNLNVLLKYIFITNKAWIRSYCVFTGQIGKIVLYPSPKIGVSIPHPPNLPKRGENLAPPLKFRKGNPVDIEKVYMKGNFNFGIFQHHWIVDLVFKIFISLVFYPDFSNINKNCPFIFLPTSHPGWGGWRFFQNHCVGGRWEFAKRRIGLSCWG